MQEAEQCIVFNNAEFIALEEICHKSKLHVVNPGLDGKGVRILIKFGSSTNVMKQELVK